MTESTSKIRIKIGTMEIDYEGDPSFLDGGIEKLLETMGELAQKAPSAVEAPIPSHAQALSTPTPAEAGSVVAGIPAPARADFTTSMIASHSGASGAVDLALCAMAYLELKLGTKPNDRSAILAEMKTVPSVYNAQMSKNNADNLKRLAKNKRINDMGSNKYSLAKDEITRFEGIIAQFD